MSRDIQNLKDLGQVVRQTRKSQKLSQDDVAGMTGFGRRFIGDLEAGKKTIQMGKVIHVLSVLGISLTVNTQTD